MPNDTFTEGGRVVLIKEGRKRRGWGCPTPNAQHKRESVNREEGDFGQRTERTNERTVGRMVQYAKFTDTA